MNSPLRSSKPRSTLGGNHLVELADAEGHSGLCQVAAIAENLLDAVVVALEMDEIRVGSSAWRDGC